MDPSILRETSQEVHDEYVKRFDKLPAFAPCDNKAAPAPPQKTVPPQEAAAGSLADKPQTADSSEANRQSGETAAGPLPEPPQQQQRSEQQAGEKLQPAAVAQRDKPEDETEKDNTKIDQILAAMKNSSAVKMDIPQIDDGKTSFVFIEETLLVPGVEGYLVASDGSVHALTQELFIVNIGNLKKSGSQSLSQEDNMLKCLHWGDFQIVLAEQSGLSIYQDLTKRVWSNPALKPRAYLIEGTARSRESTRQA